MSPNRVSPSSFPWTWALLALVTADLVCRANPALGGLLPWIDASALFVSLGLVRAVPLRAPAR